MLLEPKDYSPSREDAPCNSLGASMSWLPPETPSKPKPVKIQFCEALRQIWATLAVHCMVILVGMTLGFSAILIPQLEENDSDIKINKVDASWLASIVSIVAPIGSLSSGPVVQWLGSKQTIRLSLIPYALGWLLISFANGLPMLLAGRLITGLATTFGNTPCIVYITEVSSPHLRSMLTATGPTLGSLGILMAYVLGWLFSWRTVALVPAAWNLVCLAVLATIPESPIWLISHEKFEEARKAVYWFHNVKLKVDMSSVPEKAKELMKGLDTSRISEISDHDLENEDDKTASRRKKAEQTYTFLMDEHQRNVKKQMQNNFGNEKDYERNLLSPIPKPISPTGKSKKRSGILRRLEILFTHPTGWKPLLMLTIIFVFQQFAGVYITLFYAVNVFKEMGGGALDEYIASILVGVVRFFMSLVNIWLFRKYGRRPLITFSAAGMAICMLTSGSVLQYSQERKAALEANSFNSSEIFNNKNWSIVESPEFSSEVMINLTQNDQYYDSYNENKRVARSLDDPSPEYFSVNSFVTGNSSDEDSDIKHKNIWKDSHVIINKSEERQRDGVDNYIKNNLFLKGYNVSDYKAVAEETVIEPPLDAFRIFINSIPTICMLLYVCVSMVGFLAIPWTITAELFPTEIRSLANSIILSVANILLFSALQAYPHMLDYLGPSGVLYLFAAVSAGGGVFAYFFLPETHGRNLADIEEYFAENTVYTYPCKK